MNKYILDIETDELLAKATQVFCIVLLDVESGKCHSYTPETLNKAIKRISDADCVIGHNISGFDLPELGRHFKVVLKPSCKIVDTLILSKLICPCVATSDKKLPKKYQGSFSLAAWGHRLNCFKGDFKDFSHFSEEMLKYCEQDCQVTLKLYKYLLDRYKKLSEEYRQDINKAYVLENKVSKIIAQQTINGFYFDINDAKKLEKKLRVEQDTLRDSLVNKCPPKVIKEKNIEEKFDFFDGFTPAHIEQITEPFNPNSTQHVARVLTDVYKWQPTVFTETGLPKVDESVLRTLDLPIIPDLLRHLMLSKRLGQIADGANAWLKMYDEKTHSIHGLANPMGTRTRRFTHARPNIAQIPGSPKPYWKECRSLFTVRPGNVLVGCDASGLELRLLAHYMAFFDKGAYGELVVNGDVHSENAKILGIKRSVAKRWVYALIYGAGDEKLGMTALPPGSSPSYYKAHGARLRALFMEGLPALEHLTNLCKKAVKEKSSIKTIDGVEIYCPSEHAALNTLLQSAGAVLMKKALIIAAEKLTKEDLFVANVHDEIQVETKKERGIIVGEILKKAIISAGIFYKGRVQFDAEYQIGKNWAETH